MSLSIFFFLISISCNQKKTNNFVINGEPVAKTIV